ncbi:cytochrome P450 [Xylaria intraflava]|nr:cytochrome P450 [Xylaria intraflava]
MPSIRDLFDNGSNDGKLGWGINARNAVLLLAALLLIRQVSVTIYNLHVHPLRGIPGPQLWIAFPFLRRYLMIRGTGEAKIRELHDRYGEVVRVEANEVYFLNPQAWKDIYGHGHAEFPKHEPEGLKMDPRKIVVANAKDHFRLRRAMLPAFSEKALSQQEPLIRAYVDLLIQRLQAVSDPVNSINIVRWYNLATFDLIADLAFGESLQGLRTGRSNAWIDSIVQMFAIWPMFEAVGALGHVGSLIVLLLSPLIRHGERRHTANAAKMANGRLNARKQPDRGDFMDYFLRSRGQAHSLSDDEIIANSGLLMVAGSETSASLLSGLTYWLLKTPDALRRVTREVREAFGSEEEMTFVETRARLPYLSACMEEGLRMYPPVPFATLRRVPENTPMEVCGIMLPPKVSHIPNHTMDGKHAGPAGRKVRLTKLGRRESASITSPRVHPRSTSTDR